VNIILLIVLLIVIAISIVEYILYTNLKKQSHVAIQIQKKEYESLAAALKKSKEQIELFSLNTKEEQFARQLITHLDQAIVYVDEHKIVQYINLYASQLLPEQSKVGSRIDNCIQIIKDSSKTESVFDEAFRGKRIQLTEGYSLNSIHGPIPIIGSIIPVNTIAQTYGVIMIVSNNSERVQKEIEQKVFFSQAAHELRTPLTVIRLTIGVLMKKFTTLTPEKISEHLRRMDETSTHLVQLVNDFLNLSRLDMGRIELVNSSFDMLALTDEIIHELMPLFREKKLYIHHEMGDTEYRNVVGDRTKVKEVLTNILSNSVKYTLQGGLTVTHTSHDNVLATKVTDTGSGIPIEQQGMLFKRFMQVGGARQQSTAKSPGLG
jgi:signal transduction histidine kinase